MKQTGMKLLSIIGILAAGIVLAISIWQQIEEQGLNQVISKGAKVEVIKPGNLDDFEKVIKIKKVALPGSPLYFLKAAKDRIYLQLIRESDERIQFLLELADLRMGMVIKLYQSERGEQALKTAVKGVYYWEAAREQLSGHDKLREDHEFLWQAVIQKGELYQRILFSLRDGLNDPAKGGINLLLETLKLGLERV